MKRFVSVLLALVMVLSLTACGKSEKAKIVDEMILEIGTVTLNSEAKISAAEKAMNILSDEDRKDLDNEALLIKARSDYDQLKKEKEEADAQAAEEARIEGLKKEAASVDEAIAAIGTVTVDSGAAISAARAAYDAANSEVQSYVTRYQELEDAEQSLKQVRADVVTKQIEAACANVSADSMDAVMEAENAYKALSYDEQGLVANAGKLEEAKETIRQLNREKADALLGNFYLEDDVVRNLKFYYTHEMPRGRDYWYTDVRSFVLPYIGVDNNHAWLRLICNYTSDDWVFFEKITFAVDDERYTETFNYFDVTRDNGGGDVWEYVDINVGDSQLEMLWNIANSESTIVRFEGDDYYRDVTIPQSDKDAIREILVAYEALRDSF